MIEKIFFSKTRGEIDYSKRYTTMTSLFLNIIV